MLLAMTTGTKPASARSSTKPGDSRPLLRHARGVTLYAINCGSDRRSVRNSRLLQAAIGAFQEQRRIAELLDEFLQRTVSHHRHHTDELFPLVELHHVLRP